MRSPLSRTRSAALEGQVAAERRRSAALADGFDRLLTRIAADMTDDYYRAMGRSQAAAASQTGPSGNDPFGAAHLGVMQHCADVLSRMLNKPVDVIVHRLDHGIPLSDDGDMWMAQNDVEPGVHGDVLLHLPDGTAVPSRDRLDELVNAALAKPAAAYRR